MTNPNHGENPISGLREVMNRVRLAQEVSSMAIDYTRYDAETDPINHKFLTNFQYILPVVPLYARASFSSNCPEALASFFGVKDALDVRITATTGVFIHRPAHRLRSTASSEGYRPGLVIGEKTMSSVGPSMTEVMALGWSQQYDEAKENLAPSEPVVTIATVPTNHWNTLRDKATSQLTTPYPADVTMDLYNADYQLFIIPQTQRDLGLVSIASVYDKYRHITPETKQKHIDRKLNADFSVPNSSLLFKAATDRRLRSSDFGEYNVMSHMEYIAAAYGVGEAFDTVKAIREQQMPIHPVESKFQIAGYRRTIEEQRNSDTLPPPLPPA
jgi:hypothetical protein